MTQRRADLLLVGIAFIWGTTFTIVGQTVATFPPLALIAMRFAIAAAVFMPALRRRRREVGVHGAIVGAMLGVVLFAGFASQTFGLRYTTPARAGFITGLNVVLVPVLGLLFGQRAPARALVGVALATAGLVVLSANCTLDQASGRLICAGLNGAPEQRLGDLLILLCAFAFALHIVSVSRWGIQLPVVPVNAIQLLTVTVLAGAAVLATEWPLPVPTLGVLAAALFLGLPATALVFWLQLVLQRHTSATHTALIFALEPVFAAMFSWLWTGEMLTASVLIGGGLMLAGVIAAEVPLRTRRYTRAQEEQELLQPGSRSISQAADRR